MKNEIKKVNSPNPLKGRDRRQFLKLSSLALVGTGLLFSCSDDDDTIFTPPDEPGEDPKLFDLGSGDIGILNYAYALEQLEAAFYTAVLDGSYWMGLSSSGDQGIEKKLFEDVYNHEIIHREFFKTAIGAVDKSKRLPDLEFDFSSVDFGNQASVRNTSLVLEDTGVEAYNGAGKLIENPTYLLLAGKIVSVEARHASAFANLINPGSSDFARDSILVDLGNTGLSYDKATAPGDVIAAVGATGFIKTKFTANNLPTS